MSDYQPGIRLNKDAKTGLVKNDKGKLSLSLLPLEPLEEVARVLEFGAAKYDRNNWKKGTNWTRLADSTLRHLFSWIKGEDKDPESGLSHLAHAACNLLFLLYYTEKKVGTDDRQN